MKIRQAEESDIPAIVTLLKASLGEGLMPKSEAYWRWKHVDNPFGPSPVLVAEEGRLVGVRAFMNWQWQLGDDRISAVRAVDTATHPDFQGKGIFSRLTKSLLAHCETANVSLVFNTPNSKSKPGYLKMGWQEAGKMPVTLLPRAPLGMVVNYLSKKARSAARPDKSRNEYFLSHAGLADLLDTDLKRRNKYYVTPVSASYLRWRYQDVPVADYFIEGVERSQNLIALVVYRLKPTRLGLEMRVTDYFMDAVSAASDLTRLIRRKAAEHGAEYITTAGLSDVSILGLFSIAAGIGPAVTVRKIADGSLESFLSFNKWRPGLGDLELF